MSRQRASHELDDSRLTQWKSNFWHRFSRVWPRAAKLWVPDLWIRLPSHPSPSKVAALTFDDGPTDRGTPELLEVLAKLSVPATFFLLGCNVRESPSRAREIQTAGHAIGNHFRNHVNSFRASRRTIVREVTEGGRILEDVLGVSPQWCRPPYGILTHTLIKWSRIHRQQVVLWDVFPPDYMPWSKPEALGRTLQSHLAPNSIVCLHDNNISTERTPAMLRETLPRLIENGWQFVPLPRPLG